jgi:DNA-binding MarR family transcriptional regulator
MSAEPVAAALAAYRRLQHGLQVARTRRGTNPWLGCPLSLSQLRALSLIAARPAGLSSRELASALHVGPSAITPLVDRLVEAGYATRAPDHHDRRVIRLQATEQGTAALEQLAAGTGDLLHELLERLTPAELETVHAAFRVLLHHLERMSASSSSEAPEALAV